MVIWIIHSKYLLAQGSEEYGSGLRIKFNDAGSKYLRFIIWNQIWTRAIEMNPGSQVNLEPVGWYFDVAIRRARMLALAQINLRFLILAHWGINNQTFINGGVPNGGMTGNGGNFTSGKKPGIFFHDLWNEYAVIPAKNSETGKNNPHSFYLGFGLHYWHGVSRMTSASTLNFMAVDAPIFNWFTIEFSDQFARYMGIYAKGFLFDRLEYRMHLSKPFVTNQSLPRGARGLPILEKAVENNTGSNSWIQSGYFAYHFWEKESNLLPYTVGTYVGTKRVFNIGAGFQRMPNATKHWSLREQDTIVINNDALILGLDVFMDCPFGGNQNMALTLYSVFYNHNWGPNYYRTVGIMNVASTEKAVGYKGETNINGFGNTRPLLGTGQIWYTQVGYLLPKELLITRKKAVESDIESKSELAQGLKKQPQDRIQIFGTYTLHNLEYLKRTVHSIDIGLNYFIAGHHAKITLQYSARPNILDSGVNRQDGFLSEFILQTQVYL
ncbi:MAG: porin [Bacteroidia bacterium]|nr:porin [Bacteroidia bacterium]